MAGSSAALVYAPDIAHHFSDGLYAKQIEIAAGAQIVGHKHNYAHLSVLARGEVLVMEDGGEPVEYRAPSCIEIKAGVNHAILALRDSTWFCIHATSETDADLVDQTLIQET